MFQIFQPQHPVIEKKKTLIFSIVLFYYHSSILITTFFQTGTGLECYACGHEEEECNKDHYGETVRCQMDDPENHNYGDSCYVGHSGIFSIFRDRKRS